MVRHLYNVSWEWLSTRSKELKTATVNINDTIVEVIVEERKPSCYWVSFITKYRGTTKTKLIFEGVADFIEKFVQEKLPEQISFNGDSPIKAKTYMRQLIERAPKNGYVIDERGLEDLTTKVFTAVRRKD